MWRPAGWMKQLTGRDAMRSPGAPSLRREVERQFWVQISTGISSEKAAEAVGVSQARSGHAGSGIVAACLCSCRNPYQIGIYRSRSEKRLESCELKILVCARSPVALVAARRPYLGS